MGQNRLVKLQSQARIYKSTASKAGFCSEWLSGADRKLVLHGTMAHRPALRSVAKWSSLTIVEITLGRSLPWSPTPLRYRSEGVPLRFEFLADESRACRPGLAILDLADHCPVDHQPGSCLAYQPSGQATLWCGRYMARLDFLACRSELGFLACRSELGPWFAAQSSDS